MPAHKNKKLCAICGIKTATSSDHIPPKGIFSNPKPNDLITVPACATCNGGTSTDDEAFRTYLSIHVGISNPRTDLLWENHASRTFRHNKKLNTRIMSLMKPAVLKTESGFEPVMIGDWDGDVFRKIIEKIIRGLYYHHSELILGAQAYIETYAIESLPNELLSDSDTWSFNEVGGGKFSYRYLIDENEPLNSFWIFQFYDCCWASGYSMPIELPE